MRPANGVRHRRSSRRTLDARGRVAAALRETGARPSANPTKSWCTPGAVGRRTPLGLELTPKPGASEFPFALDGGMRDTQNTGRLGDCQTAERTQFDDLRVTR